MVECQQQNILILNDCMRKYPTFIMKRNYKRNSFTICFLTTAPLGEQIFIKTIDQKRKVPLGMKYNLALSKGHIAEILGIKNYL